MKTLWLTIAATLLVGCALEDPVGVAAAVEFTDSGDITAHLSEPERACMIDLVNDCARDREFFDITLAWDGRAATALVDWRAADDRTCGTADDVLITDISWIDALPHVGDRAIRSLRDFVVDIGCVQPITFAVVEGVPFTRDEAEKVLALVNQISAQSLDSSAGIQVAAAKNIVFFAPYDASDPIQGLLALAAVPLVSPTVLERLKSFVTSLGTEPVCDPLAGLFSGVAFSGEQAHDVLDAVNRAEQAQLMFYSGVGAALSTRLLLARDAAGGLQSIAALDHVAGIDSAVLTALRDETASVWCGIELASCGCTAAWEPPTAVEDALANAQTLLEMQGASVSDRRRFERFHRLLGAASYERMVVLAMSELAKHFKSNPPAGGNTDLTSVVQKALSAILTAPRFAHPFDWLSATQPAADNFGVARQLATDTLIQTLGNPELAPSGVLSAPFETLIAPGEWEDQYLGDIDRWRQSDGLAVSESAKLWVFVGPLLGVTCEVTVSRISGHVLDISLTPVE